MNLILALVVALLPSILCQQGFSLVTTLPHQNPVTSLSFATVSRGYALSRDEIYLSFDAGYNWQKSAINGWEQATLTTIIASNETTVFACGTDFVKNPAQATFLSTDGGVNFNLVPSSPSVPINCIASTYYNGNIYLVSSVDTKESLHISADGGATWTVQTLLQDANPYTKISVVQSASGIGNTIFLSTARSVYTSEDNGRTWQPIYTKTAGINGVANVDSQQAIWVEHIDSLDSILLTNDEFKTTNIQYVAPAGAFIGLTSIATGNFYAVSYVSRSNQGFRSVGIVYSPDLANWKIALDSTVQDTAYTAFTANPSGNIYIANNNVLSLFTIGF